MIQAERVRLVTNSLAPHGSCGKVRLSILVHECGYRVKVKRLLKARHDTCCHGRSIKSPERCHENDRQRGKAALALLLTEKLPPGHLRHSHIKQNQSGQRAAAVQTRQGLTPIARGYDFMAALLQKSRE